MLAAGMAIVFLGVAEGGRAGTAARRVLLSCPGGPLDAFGVLGRVRCRSIATGGQARSRCRCVREWDATKSKAAPHPPRRPHEPPLQRRGERGTKSDRALTTPSYQPRRPSRSELPWPGIASPGTRHHDTAISPGRGSHRSKTTADRSAEPGTPQARHDASRGTAGA